MLAKYFTVSNTKGFTLYELMIGLAIGGVLIGIGLPNLNQFLAAQKTNTQVNELINTIKEAKATAVTLNTQTLIIPTAGDYSNGWQIKGVYSMIIGFIFAASTIWNVELRFLQSFAWLIGAFTSYITYYLLASD